MIFPSIFRLKIDLERDFSHFASLGNKHTQIQDPHQFNNKSVKRLRINIFSVPNTTNINIFHEKYILVPTPSSPHQQ